MVEEYSKYPICDTNIIIDLNFGQVFQSFLQKKKKVFLADKVVLELKRKVQTLPNYKYLFDSIKSEKVLIIESNEFTENQIKVMNANLLDYNIQNCIGTNYLCEDIGEFVSALYAVNLGIKVLKTNDKEFIDKYGKEKMFEKLKMIDLNQTLRNLLDDKERIKIMSIIAKKNSRMKSEINNEKRILKMKRILESKYGNN